MSGRELLQIPVDVTAHPETGERWEELRAAVASELDTTPESLSKWEVLREASEAYLGNSPRGEWRDDG